MAYLRHPLVHEDDPDHRHVDEVADGGVVVHGRDLHMARQRKVKAETRESVGVGVGVVRALTMFMMVSRYVSMSPSWWKAVMD